MAAREANLLLAGKLQKALPADIRKSSEIVDKPGKPYTILKVNGHSVASVRDGAVRIVHRIGDDAASIEKFAALIAEAAPEPKPVKEPKAKKEPAKKPAKKSTKKDDGLSAEQEAERAVEAANEADAEAAASAEGKADDADAK